MPSPQIPTKSALKRKYGITTDDFKIITQQELPSKAELEKDGTTLQQVADWFDLPTYLVKRGMAVIAILLAPATVTHTKQDARESMQFYAGLFKPFSNLPKPADDPYPMYANTSNVAVTSSTVTTLTTGTPGSSA